MQTQRDFEQFYETNDPWGVESWHPRERRIIDFVGSGHAQKNVDLCCGEGRITSILARNGWSSIGVDFSSTAIYRAQRKHSHIEFLCQDVLTMRIEGFHLVTAFECLYYFDRESVLDFLRKKIKPHVVDGGRFVFSGPIANGYFDWETIGNFSTACGGVFRAAPITFNYHRIPFGIRHLVYAVDNLTPLSSKILNSFPDAWVNQWVVEIVKGS